MTGRVWLRTRTSSTTCFYMRKALPPRAVELTEGGRGEGGIVFVEDDRCVRDDGGEEAHSLYIQKTIAFRTPKQGECYQGEPRPFAKDMWFHGYGAGGSWEVTSYPVLNSKYMIQPRWTKCSVTYIRRRVMFRREGYPGHGIVVDS
jgi:hypothetical protein